MSDAAALRDVIARLEAATGPDRELDAEIALAAGWTHPAPMHGISERERLQCWIAPGGHPEAPWHSGPPCFTSSLDAAVSLVPEGWVVLAMSWLPADKCWAVALENGRGLHAVGKAATEPLARSLAAIGARLAMMEASHDA